MAKKVIKMNLSEKSISDAIKSLKAYRKDIQHKTDLLRERIANMLKQYAQQGFNNAVVDDLIKDGIRMAQVDVTVDPVSDNVTLVVAHGEDAVWVEFGAGVYHNGSVGSSPHPKGDDFGFLIGTYGKGNGKKNTWGFVDKEGLHITHGTPASMPMYKAMEIVQNDLRNIYKEVFG